MKTCYWSHTHDEQQLFPCYDDENLVCGRCCVEHCPSETPDVFASCAAAGHPTWPIRRGDVPRTLVCIEGYWHDAHLFDRSTVRPFLDGLSAVSGSPIAVAHRRVGSVQAFERLAKQTIWDDSRASLSPVFYLAFHGRKGHVQIGDAEVDFTHLIDAFDGYGGAPHLIYFGTCSTLGGPAGHKLSKGLLERVGSRAVVGYTQDVDWMKSMLIDLLFMEKFYSTADPWADGELKRIYDEVMDEMSFAKRLGFTIVLPS